MKVLNLLTEKQYRKKNQSLVAECGASSALFCTYSAVWLS